MDNYITQKWHELIAPYAPDQEIAAALLEEIRSKYNQSNRYYHNLQHITTMLQLAEQYEEKIKDKATVNFAIFYHDLVYDTSSSNNEEKSAKKASQYLAKLKVGPESIAKVSDYILATKMHEVQEVDQDLMYFLDFDLSILGADPISYSNYSKAIRKEFSIYPDFIYKPGRAKVLKALLQKKQLYQTLIFRERLEQAARINISNELEEIER